MLLRLCSALALSMLLGHGGIERRTGGFMAVADAFPAQALPQSPFHQAVLAGPLLGETTFTAAGTEGSDDPANPTVFRVLAEHSASKKSIARRDPSSHKKKTPTDQNGHTGQDAQHRDFLNLASKVSGKSTSQIDQELSTERRRVQQEHEAHFRLIQKQQQLLLRKQNQHHRLEDDENVEGATVAEADEEDYYGEGGKRQQRRVHGKGAGRIRLPMDVTKPSKRRGKDKKVDGHDSDHDHERGLKKEKDDDNDDDDDDHHEGGEDEDGERDEGEDDDEDEDVDDDEDEDVDDDEDEDEDDDEDEDEDDNEDVDEAENFARRPHKHRKDKKTKSKKSSKDRAKNQANEREDEEESFEDAVEYQFRKQKLTPAIFYVPHQDDDALAMALAIREHLDTGRKVIVHLYSDGINALLRDIVAGAAPCPLSHAPHRFNLTLQDVVTGRTHEFRQSLLALGVKAENIHETGWSDIEPLKDYEAFQRKLKNLILEYEKKYPGASHKCISGEYDRDSVGRNPTHRACWDVATRLLNKFPKGWPDSHQLWDFRFYRTYTYYNPAPRRSAQFIRAMPQFLPYKQKALDQYKRWEPKQGELAWGYHSVKSLIDAAYNDPHVYMDMLDNDPTNPANWYALPRMAKALGTSMFPDVWKSNREKDWNQALIQAQEEAQILPQQGDHDEKDNGGNSDPNTGDSERQGNELLIEEAEIEDQESPAAKWDEKEVAMRKEILKAFDKAARGPEGGMYRIQNLKS